MALKSHTAAGLLRFCDQCRVAKQIHFGLTVQDYDLPEVHLIVEILRLIEELCDVRFKFSVQFCELESNVCNMNVRIFFLIVVIINFGV